jgi:integrase
VRPRKKDRHLPACVYLRRGGYYYVKKGVWHPLGKNLSDALRRYSTMYDGPKGGMADLIGTALAHMLKSVKPNTAAQYRGAAKKLAKVFAEFGPQDVRPKHVAAFKASMVAKPNMGNRCLSVLRQVFDYALEREIIDTNPAIGVKRLPEAKRTRLLTRAEYGAIYANAGPRLQVILDLSLLTGQRIGDVLGIMRADLLDAGIRFKQQKTGERLTVLWTDELREVVRRAKALNGNIVAMTLLHNRRGKKPDYRTIREQWEKARQAAKVQDAHLHDLRAMSATWARAQGKNPTALMGHRSESQTDRYLRDRQDALVEGPSIGQSKTHRRK